MTAVPLRSLPIRPDPEWYGYPGRNPGERLSHGYASGAPGAPSLCGRTTYRGPFDFGARPRRICPACRERWQRQYPPVGRGTLR